MRATRTVKRLRMWRVTIKGGMCYAATSLESSANLEMFLSWIPLLFVLSLISLLAALAELRDKDFIIQSIIVMRAVTAMQAGFYCDYKLRMNMEISFSFFK